MYYTVLASYFNIVIFVPEVIMQNLELAIQQALDTSGNLKEANKAYLEFIKANFLVPVEKQAEAESPMVLFFQNGDDTFLPVFTDRQYFDSWASDIADKIEILSLSGVDLLKGIGDDITVCLNIGSAIYKEFNPSEIARMRSMILKFF
jgi:hypothetical protein